MWFSKRTQSTISKHDELPESYFDTLGRLTEGRKIKTRGRDEFWRERRRAVSRQEREYDAHDSARSRRPPPQQPSSTRRRLDLAQRISAQEFETWCSIFERSGFTVPPPLGQLTFQPFWGPVMAEREKGQPCLRTMYCLPKTSSQALFKQMVLCFASVQSLCDVGLSSQWLRARLEAAA